MKIPFTQTKEYLNWHEKVGEKTFYKEFFGNVEGEEKLVAVCASLIIQLRIGKVLYVPYGPVFFTSVPYGGIKNVEQEVVSYLHDLAKEEHCVFVRLEDEKKVFQKPLRLPLVSRGIFFPPVKSFAREGIFQPRVEWWLGLNDTEENIYNNFHKDHRYSIRRAEKENIQIEIIENNLLNYFEKFWNLIRETSERDGFRLYSEEYYRSVFSPLPYGGVKRFLIFTKKDEQYLSVALIVESGKMANLVFAGSVSEKRELGFNHFMQWKAIKKAKEMGCEFYNFGGIYDGTYGKSGLLGVTNFKKRFGGFSKFHGVFVDMPIKKVKYFLYLLRKILS